MDDLENWTVEKIRQWMYAIGERSDRVISEAMLDDDWSDHEDDERMHEALNAELMRRGITYHGESK